MLTLRKLLETVADYDRRVELAIETKHPTRYGGLVERRLVEMLRRVRLGPAPDSPARVMSFSLHRAAAGTSGWRPGLRLVQLVDKAHHWPVLRRVIGADWIVGPGHQELREHPGLRRHLVRAARVHVWTVNTAATSSSAWTSASKAVITDRPAYMLELLAGSSPRLSLTTRHYVLGRRFGHGKEVAHQAARQSAAAAGEVGPRQPCPCGSGKRYKACHGAAGGAAASYVARPFEGMPSECDIVALRELVPAATAPLTSRSADRPCCSARCCRWPRRRWCATAARSGWACRCSTTSATRPATSAPCSQAALAPTSPASSA